MSADEDSSVHVGELATRHPVGAISVINTYNRIGVASAAVPPLRD